MASSEAKESDAAVVAVAVEECSRNLMSAFADQEEEMQAEDSSFGAQEARSVLHNL